MGVASVSSLDSHIRGVVTPPFGTLIGLFREFFF